MALLTAPVLTPTDAALGQSVVSSPDVPDQLGQSINSESGLNDGLAFPFVLNGGDPRISRIERRGEYRWRCRLGDQAGPPRSRCRDRRRLVSGARHGRRPGSGSHRRSGGRGRCHAACTPYRPGIAIELRQVQGATSLPIPPERRTYAEPHLGRDDIDNRSTSWSCRCPLYRRSQWRPTH